MEQFEGSSKDREEMKERAWRGKGKGKVSEHRWSFILSSIYRVGYIANAKAEKGKGSRSTVMKAFAAHSKM